MMEWLNPQIEVDTWREEWKRLLEPWPAFPPHPPIQLNPSIHCGKVESEVLEVNEDAN